MTLRRFVITILAAICAAPAFAQGNAKGDPDAIIAQFERRFTTLDSLIFRVKGDYSDPSRDIFADASRKYGDTLLADSLYNDALIKSVDAQARVIKSATGLSMTGQTYYRLDDEFGFDDEDQVSRYNAKAQAEIRWNYFKSSFYKRKGKIREVQIQADIDRLEYAKETRGIEYARQREFYRARQDSALCAILSHRVANLSLLSDAYLYLLGNENISSDNLMQVLSEKAEAERKLAGLTVHNVVSSNLSTPEAYIVQLDTAAFLKYVDMNQADFKIARRRKDLLEQRAKNVSYWNDATLSPFIRYSYYFRPYATNSSNVDVGLVFTLPLTAESEKQKKALFAQGAAMGAEQYLRMRQIADEVNYVAIEVDRLNRSIEGEFRRSVELKKYIDMRTRAYYYRKGEYDRLSRMKEYNAYLLCLERLLEFQYSRDQQIATLAKFLTGEDVGDFCSIEYFSEDSK